MDRKASANQNTMSCNIYDIGFILSSVFANFPVQFY